MTTSPRMLIDLFELKNRIYSTAIVTVKQESDDAEATLYQDPTGTDTLLNPQTLDSDGKFAQAVYIDVPAYCSIDAIHVPNHDTGILRPPVYAADSGTTALRPTLASDDIGYEYFDTTLGLPVWWDGSDWLDATGASA